MAPIKAATNAGPLIYLAILGHHDLLRRCYDRVLIPQAVYHEVVVQGAGRMKLSPQRQTDGTRSSA